MNKIDLKDILQENLADDNQDYLSILGRREGDAQRPHGYSRHSANFTATEHGSVPRRHNSYKYWQGKVIETHPVRV